MGSQESSCCAAKDEKNTEALEDGMDLTSGGDPANTTQPAKTLAIPPVSNRQLPEEEVLEFPGESKMSPRDETKAVRVSMTLDNIDYNDLLRDEGLLNSFGKKVKETIAAAAENGVKEDHIEIELTRGSVKVDAKVQHPNPDADHASVLQLQSALKGSSMLSENMIDSVKRIPGIEKVCSGQISIRNISVRGHGEETPAESNVVADTFAGFQEPEPPRDGITTIKEGDEKQEPQAPLLEPAQVQMMQKKPPFVGESKMEELQLNGLSGVMDDDWAADAQRAVITGSDGLWIRFGATPGPSFCQQCFAFQFNPCVSFFAVLLLFGLVAFCCVKPGQFCTQTIEVYSFVDTGGTTRNLKLVDPQPATFPTGTNTLLYVINGALSISGVASKTFNALLSTTTKKMTVESQTYDITIRSMIEDQTCFMPKKEFDDWMAWVTECFTWLYIITQNVWIVFAVWLYFSKYGAVKLGRDEDEPEFTYFAWFSMLFTCGVATGLFYFAVTEPQYYYLINSQNNGYSERNRWSYSGVYVNSGTPSPTGVWATPNDRAQNAMTTTWYHWGLHGWVCYCLLGVLLAFLHFRKGLPMTIKSCFYPLMGMRIYGFMGDFIDTISVVATTMGVCTSLGLGVIQLNTGLEMLNGDQHWLGEGYYNQYNWNAWSDKEADLKTYWDSWSESLKLASPWYNSTGHTQISTVASVAKVEAQSNQQMLLIWIITTSATCSVMLGLKNGIKQLALLCLALGQFVIFYVWMMDDTWFLSNLFIQTMGSYIGQLPVLGFYSSAVEQSEVNNPYGEYSSWQFWWTIFYWGWWIAWAPFVGVFLARVGKARTVREFVFCTLFSACIYNFIFMTILGGAGLKMQMLAEIHKVGTPGTGPAGLDNWRAGCSNDVIQQAPDGTYYRSISYKANVCRPTSTRKYSGEKEMFCSTITNLACSLKADGTRPLFDVMQQYADVAKGMTVILLITITLYFVASSDSGSMVDDMITANGFPEPCLTQRLFWALTEGAAATALLSIGKYVGQADGGLKALRSASICVGLPYTFLICFMCVSLYRALQYEVGDRSWTAGSFQNSVLDIGFTLYKCGPSLEGGQKTRCFNGMRGSCDCRKFLELLRNFFCPPIAMWSITSKMANKRTGNRNSIGTMILVVSVSLFFVMWFTLMWVDYSPLSTNLQEWGSVQGNASNANGNSRYYLSNRWGYYHQWANKDAERADGDFIKWNLAVNYKGQEKANEATINGVTTSVGVGERMAFNYRIAVVGWFFFFVFVMYLVSLRSDIRVLMNIQGTLIEDFLVCLFWPCALWQMDDQLNLATPSSVEDKKVI